MNFSDHSKLKKYISLGLSVCLVAALFTGCKKDDDTPDTSSNNTPNLNLNLSSSEPSSEPTVSASTEPTVKITDKTGVVLSSINVRGLPSQDATITATLSAGDRVEVVRQEPMGGVTWGYITDPLGWIVMDYVKMDMEQADPAGSDTSTPAGNGDVTPPAATQPVTPSNTTEIKGTITGNQVNIRSDPSTTGMIQGSYNKGDTVTILETKNGWGRTNKGWVKMDYVKTSDTTTNTNTNTNTTTTNNNVSGNGSTTVQFRGVVIAKELNIRSDATQNSDRVGGYTYGKRVEFLEKDGNWGRTSDGWISLNYVYQDGTTGTNTATGTVVTDGLRVRSGPGTGYDVVGSVNSGDTVKILEQFTYGDTTWGCTKNGWISMDYVDVDGDDDNSDWDDTVNSAQSGSITGSGVRIRSGAGTDYGVVGSYDFGDRVTIYETKKVGGTTWGKVDDGWVSMDYVDLD